MLPLAALRWPVIVRATEERPLPTNPYSPTISPGAMSNDTPFAAPPYRSRTEITGSLPDVCAGAGRANALSAWPIISVVISSGVESAVLTTLTSSPLRSTAIRSHISNTSLSRCETKMMQVPDSFSRRTSSRMSLKCSSLVDAVVSSKIMILCGATSARARDSICRCPGPRSRASCLVRSSPSPTWRSTSRVSWLLLSTFCAHGRMSLPMRSLYSQTFSPIVKSSIMSGSWCIISTPACSASAAL